MATKLMSDEALAEQGLVRLPVGADGEPIGIGDRVEEVDGGKFTVTAICLSMDDTAAFWRVNGSAPRDLRHRGATPAERIRRFVSDNEDTAAGLHWEELLDVAAELEGESA